MPLIGFGGAPLTLAAYLVEGGGSKDFRNIKALLYSRPEVGLELLDKLAEQVARHLEMQVEAGCSAVQVFDSWAAILNTHDYRRFAVPGIRKIMDGVAHLGVPRILFSKGGLTNLPWLLDSGADALSVDWTCDLREAARLAPAMTFQGNLDPVVLHGSAEEIVKRTRAVCRAGDRAAGHVFNLGHGILTETPPDNLALLVDTVHNHQPEA